jgi:HTH-type transcriptional regulator / antitoxin HipB
MPFEKMNIKDEIKKRIESDPEFEGAYIQAKKEYQLISQLVKLRKSLNITQKEISTKTGLTQQMVSRIEKFDNSPTLNNFIQYINAMDLEIEFKKKTKKCENV